MLLSKSLNLFKSFVVDPYFHDLVKKASFMRYQHIHQVGLMSSDDAWWSLMLSSCSLPATALAPEPSSPLYLPNHHLRAVRLVTKAGLFGFFFSRNSIFSHNNSAGTVFLSQIQPSERLTFFLNSIFNRLLISSIIPKKYDIRDYGYFNIDYYLSYPDI